MATTIALLIALVAYTATVVVVNTLRATEGAAAYNFNIQDAFNTIATHPMVTDIIPAAAEPLNMVVAGIGLIIPAIISFWIVCFIIK